MAISQNFPSIRPTLSLNFASSRTLDPRITFRRNSIGTYFDSNSVLRTASANVARIDHDPLTGESLGLLVEEPRENSIRNNTMQGAVAGTPGTLPTNWVVTSLGTLSQQIVEVGTVNGINYIDWRISGTSSTASVTIGFEPTAQIAALSGETWSHSCHIARVAGSSTNIAYCGLGVYERTSTGSFVVANNSPTNLANTTTFARQSYSVTLSGGGTVARVQPLIVLSITSGAAIDITLRIGLPQLEQGAFATSVIPTTGATVPRSADVASITGANFSSWASASTHTLFAEIQRSSAVNANTQVASLSDGTTNNRISLRLDANGTTSTFVGVNSGTLDGVVQVTTGVAGSVIRQVGAAEINNYQLATNGVLSTVDTTALIPSVNRLEIGQVSETAQFNGTIRRLVYWPVRLPTSVLQAITS